MDSGAGVGGWFWGIKAPGGPTSGSGGRCTPEGPLPLPTAAAAAAAVNGTGWGALLRSLAVLRAMFLVPPIIHDNYGKLTPG